MASEWLNCRWGDIVTLEYGKSLRDYEKKSGEYRVYGTNGPIGWHGKPLCFHPGVIVGRKGAYRGIHYSKEPFYVIDTAFYLEPKEDIDLRWAYYELLTHDINNMDSGSAIPSTSREAFYALAVKVPPKEGQHAIAQILGLLDDKIELNRRMNETLEAIARAVFNSWFVDFDPVRAKAEGRDTGLPKHIADLFPDHFRDSVIGPIPAAWEQGRFGDLVEILRDQVNPMDAPNSLFLHYSIPAFDEGQEPKLEAGENIKSLKFRVPPNVVLLSKLNPEIERVWLVNARDEERGVCSTEFLVLDPKASFRRAYVYCLERSCMFRQELEGLVTGTSKSHQRAHAHDIMKIAVLLPPVSLVAQFERTGETLLERTLSNRSESCTLAALRDTLLPKLISGELRVKDAERLIGRAL